ncbi:hypothetical protein FACS1894105_10910 [Clostridia bacterium]|nr:hypothetical protein FACS1894105_10910 [Clostridia bacterium]
MELLQCRPADCLEIIVSRDFTDADGIVRKLAASNNIAVTVDDRTIARLSPKENCYCIGVFAKRGYNIARDASHIALDHPSDMGNLGTIIRTALGFNFRDIAIIGDGADAYNPKTVRASMGAVFHSNIEYFKSFGEYREAVSPNRDVFTFELTGAVNLRKASAERKQSAYTLVFGNESRGLDRDTYRNAGTSVKIAHTSEIDSLSLPVAASLAMYEFTCKLLPVEATR